ncbi:MAG TPA: NAD-dependent epimerase/dehydratase family protein [Candidatus Acidoferrales bacterium]|nr:NAD-dependent epimerase/dehydratase family protein [Candidatus Acidoferrales bacterium]
MRVLVLGGDGFCGWPTALHLSARGMDVALLDNFSRRRIERQIGAASLTPIASMEERLATWQALSGRALDFTELDLAQDYESLCTLLTHLAPDAIVHFAEQRSAPYSMRSPATKRYTVQNNLAATHNLLCALVEIGLDAHVVHLGTMGVYGYGSTDAPIPEGYLPIRVSNAEGQWVEREILHPTDPGSVYHMTKAQDQLLFAFYNKNDGLRITDLHQGIVWGTQTVETQLDERLINRFDYDGDYGTVLNRFLMQAAVGHPLTVHGTGGQTRAFIHIQDTVRCIELALRSPPRSGERVRIMNQVTETHRVRDLAALVAQQTGATVRFLPNPRREPPENELRADGRRLQELGLKPTTLSAGLMQEVHEIARRYAARCDLRKIPSTVRWRQDEGEVPTVAVA